MINAMGSLILGVCFGSALAKLFVLGEITASTLVLAILISSVGFIMATYKE